MAMEGPDPNPSSDHILEWFGDSLSYFPTFFDDPYDAGDFTGDSWWTQPQGLEQEQEQQFVYNSDACNFTSSITTTAITTSTIPKDESMIMCNQVPTINQKRKVPEDDVLKLKTARKNTNRRASEPADMGQGQVQGQGGIVGARKSAGNKRANAKSTGNNSTNGNSKEGRWAEHLLNPCAAAITARNLSRVQHFLYVLHDLSSLTGDANHRLAAHGLEALKLHLSSSHGGFPSAPVGDTFASSDPRFFRDSLIKFNDINPWFRIPNNVANTSILQILAEQDHPTNLHILDIGVSHGVQWPTLLEELTRRSGGPPPLVRLTVLSPAIGYEQSRNIPFAAAPQNYDFSSNLLSFAKVININLQINVLDNIPLQSLSSEVINSSAEETLVICAQFRLHNLNHNIPDDRTEFLRVLRGLEPKGVILSENNTDCSCSGCGDFATGFSRRVEYLWKFLDSTSAAYKGRESDQRRMMEGEAAKALVNLGEMNERKERWCQRMRGVGFAAEVLGEETVDGARALLRKYDSNWEVRVEEKDGCIGLRWKGQPVSFCSLWKTDTKAKRC